MAVGPIVQPVRMTRVRGLEGACGACRRCWWRGLLVRLKALIQPQKSLERLSSRMRAVCISGTVYMVEFMGFVGVIWSL